MGTTRESVIIVADEDDSIRALRRALEWAGYLVLQARNSAEALARMRNEPGRMVAVLNMSRAGLDAEPLISTLRADRKLATTPLIVLTAANLEDVEGARVLRAPYRLKDILSMVRELCPVGS